MLTIQSIVPPNAWVEVHHRDDMLPPILGEANPSDTSGDVQVLLSFLYLLDLSPPCFFSALGLAG